MKEMKRESVRIKRMVADLSLEKKALKDVASGNSYALSDAGKLPGPIARASD